MSKVQRQSTFKPCDPGHEKQHTIAKVDMSVDLPADFKGTHMSRFIEALEEWRENAEEKLDYGSLKSLLEQVRSKLNAQKAFISFNFPNFITKIAQKLLFPISAVLQANGITHGNAPFSA